MSLGDSIRRLRSRSPFPERKTFAFRAGISVEGLRKIENDTRVPERATLDKILEVASCPDGIADSILNEWSTTQAKKLGVRIQTDSSPETLAEVLVDDIEQYIVGHEWSIPDNWKDDLKTIVAGRLKDAVQHTGP